MSEVARTLEAAQRGELDAANRLADLVYRELRKLAAHKMAGERPGHTLQPTALVHEAWLRLNVAGSKTGFQNRAHFFGAAAEAMRRILIEHARSRGAKKRGGGIAPLELEEIEIACPATGDELLQVNEALEKLSAIDKPKADLVKFRYFLGLSYEEAAAALEIAVPTAKQWWSFARAWLAVEMGKR